MPIGKSAAFQAVFLIALFSAGNALLACGYENLAFQAVNH
jgi:hypothetical protein